MPLMSAGYRQNSLTLRVLSLSDGEALKQRVQAEGLYSLLGMLSIENTSTFSKLLGNENFPAQKSLQEA